MDSGTSRGCGCCDSEDERCDMIDESAGEETAGQTFESAENEADEHRRIGEGIGDA